MFGFFKKREKVSREASEPAYEEKRPMESPAVAESAPAVEGGDSGGEISISLDGIVCLLPEEIKKQQVGRIPANVAVSIPINEVVHQLSRGSVRVAFGIIRRQSPPQAFATDGSFDQMQVTLPLGEVLKQLSPEHFKRRESQEEVVVADDIPMVFNPDGSSVEQPAEPAIPSRPAPAEAAPPAADSQKKESGPVPSEAPAARPESATPEPAAPSKPISMPPLSKPLAPPEPAIAAVEGGPASKPLGEAGALVVPLGQVMAEWPEEIRNALNDEAVQSAQLHVPVDEVEPGMKQGKLAFSWRAIHSWIHPPISASVSAPDSQQVELPLSVMVPLFLQKNKPKVQGEDVRVREDIPEIFENKRPTFGVEPKPGTEEPAKPAHDEAAPAPAPSAAPASASQPVTASAPAESKTPQKPPEISALFNQPEKLEWSLAEIAQEARKMASADVLIVALSDGLPVASSYAGDMDPNPVAGLLPALYNHATQLARTLSVDPQGLLQVQFESRRIALLNQGKVYMGVVASANASLPVESLRKVLDHLAGQLN